MTICEAMNTVELVARGKALPAREQRKFFATLRAVEEQSRPRRRPATIRIEWPDVEARAKRIFGKSVLPNLVLLERDEKAL